MKRFHSGAAGWLSALRMGRQSPDAAHWERVSPREIAAILAAFALLGLALYGLALLFGPRP